VPRVRPGEAANPAPPTVQRIRLRFAKRGRLRFLSHRDVARSFERAVRRAGVPVAHSHGYSPHPRLSWVGAAPTGTASEAEYLEIGLTRTVDPAELVAALDAALPDGIDVLEAAVADGSALAERIDASR
jgi:radical SAM-linked protein